MDGRKIMKTDKSPEELYEEREKRLRDAIELKEPDRVPVVLAINYFPARYVGGLTVADAFYNHDAWREATRKTIMDLEPDIIALGAGGSGLALGALSPKLFKWPGDGLGPNTMHQFIEGEPLKADEYDLFFSDPGDFTLRYYLPRVWTALEPFSKLPPLQSLWGSSTMALRAASFATPEIIQAFEALFKAGQEAEKYTQAVSTLDEEMASLGFPALHHGGVSPPFDTISDYLRGMRGTMLDMHRNPDKLLQICEMLLPRSIASGAVTLQSKRGNPKRVGSYLHNGSDELMSPKQFETFYWPTLKKVTMAMTDMGLVHIPLYEADWTSRLEHLHELPKGKTVARFALTDMVKAKEVLGGHTCIMGGIPHGMLQTATPQEVEEHCKNLIKVVGKGGGFILSTNTGITSEAKPENVRAMIESAKKYGRYS
jgi:uroporphyrinogen-III decarboxylase